MENTVVGTKRDGKASPKSVEVTLPPSRPSSLGRFVRSIVTVLTILAMIAFGTINLSILKKDSCQSVRQRLRTLNSTLVKVQASLESSREQLSTAKRKLNDSEARLSAAQSNISTVLGRATIAEQRVQHLEASSQSQDNDKEIIDASQQLAMRARRNRSYPACVKNGTRAPAFMMVFMGHSGSTAILSELHSHSQVLKGFWEPVDHQKVFNTTEALEIARGIFQKGLQENLTAGFKIRPVHILERPHEWRALVKQYQVRIIWQYRRNVFKGAVGEYVHRYLHDNSVVEGLKTDITREERCQIGVGCRFRVEDFDFLRRQIGTMTRSTHFILRAVSEIARDSRCVREIPYEDYLYSRDAVLKDLQTFLGLEEEETAPARFKATGDSLCETVENWDELCEAFYGCPKWQHLLDDVQNNCYCHMSSGAPSAEFCDYR